MKFQCFLYHIMRLPERKILEKRNESSFIVKLENLVCSFHGLWSMVYGLWSMVHPSSSTLNPQPLISPIPNPTFSQKPYLYLMESISYIFRRPAPQFNSIENVFNAIIPYIEKEYKVHRYEVPFKSSSFRNIFRNLSFVRNIRNSDLIHITGHDNYLTINESANTVLTIHDIGSALNGPFYRKAIISRYWFQLPIKKAKALTAISRFSAGEIITHYPAAKGKLFIIPDPVDDRFQYSPGEFRKEEPVLLHVGTKTNKNLERVASAIKDLKVKLLILGKLSERQEKLLHSLNINYKNYVHIPIEQVVEFYKSSDILIFPSTYEGFGMPILEAQATGRPVITSGIGAMAELAGKSAELVDPYNIESIRSGILNITKNENYRINLIERGKENVNKYRAERIAKQYIEFYKHIAT